MIGILIVTVSAFIISIILVIFDHSMDSKEEQEKKFLELLPGYNCGVCGYGGCKGMSEAMCENVENYKKCRLLKADKLEKMKQYIDSIK